MQIWLKSASWFMRFVHTSICWLKFSSLSPAVTLKNSSRSSKPNQLFIMSQCYIHANLVEIYQTVYEIWCTQALFDLNLAVTLKIRTQVRWMPRLIWVFFGYMSFLLVLSCFDSYNFQELKRIPVLLERCNSGKLQCPATALIKIMCPLDICTLFWHCWK